MVFEAKVKVLSEMIKHHVHEEEMRSEGMFAQVRSAQIDLEELGRKMEARKAEVLAEFAARGLPEPATRAFGGNKLRHVEPEPAAQPA